MLDNPSGDMSTGVPRTKDGLSPSSGVTINVDHRVGVPCGSPAVPLRLIMAPEPLVDTTTGNTDGLTFCV